MEECLASTGAIKKSMADMKRLKETLLGNQAAMECGLITVPDNVKSPLRYAEQILPNTTLYGKEGSERVSLLRGIQHGDLSLRMSNVILCIDVDRAEKFLDKYDDIMEYYEDTLSARALAV